MKYYINREYFSVFYKRRYNGEENLTSLRHSHKNSEIIIRKLQQQEKVNTQSKTLGPGNQELKDRGTKTKDMRNNGYKN